MKIRYVLLFVFSTSLLLGQYTSPYKLSIHTDVPISFSAISFLGSSFMVGLQQKKPDRLFIEGLDARKINWLDRNAVTQWDTKAALASDVLMYTSMSLPLLHLADSRSRRDAKTISAMWAQVFLLNLGVTSLIKEIGSRPRPYMYNGSVSMDKKMKKEGLRSFFSGHVSTTASMSFFFAKTFHDYHPNSKLRPMVWTLCALTPAVTGFLRWKAGKHFWTDILTGYAVGALIGVGVPWLHQTARTFNQR